jgi:4'-phosphopantetheinyl transferase
MDVYWLEQTFADVPADDDWLSAREAACLGSLRFARRRADWRLGRWTAKRALAVHLGLTNVEIRAAPDGAPEVFVTNAPAPVTISLSHRAGKAVCAVAGPGAALGCDVERIEPRDDSFVADYFTVDEQGLVVRASAPERALIVTLLWSAKESALKALRVGLRADIRSVTVSPMFSTAPGWRGWQPLDARYIDGRGFRGWWKYNGEMLWTLLAQWDRVEKPTCRDTRGGCWNEMQRHRLEDTRG